MSKSYPLGKIPNDDLKELLRRIDLTDPRVVVGPGIGLDAAVLDIGDRYLVTKTDPITFATDRIGWYAVHVNANDIACTGAQPLWFMATALLPEGAASMELAESIFEQIQEACAGIGVSLIGGHTEITHGIDHPLLIGCMLGEVEKDRLVTAAGARPGESILLAGAIPIEATAILAGEFAEALSESFDESYLERCRGFLDDPGISIVPAARLAEANGAVTAMHDPTEGGLAAGLWELAHASGQGLEVERSRIPLLPEGAALCEALGLDPLGSIASGSLLLTTPDAASIEAALRAEGIVCERIGRVLDEYGAGVRWAEDGRELEPPERDEIARLFDEL